MLIRLTAEQISIFWDIIKYAIEESYPPTVKMGATEIGEVLEDLLSGASDCWVSFQREESNKIDGILVTKVVIDHASKVRNLLIYTLFAYAPSLQSSWQEGLEVLAKWAKKKRCYQIIGFTSEPMIIQHVNKLGGDSSITLIRFDIDKLLSEED